MNINEIKKEEVQTVINFLQHLEDYGHIYYYPDKWLDEPFRKILEGISEIKKLMDDSWER